MVQKPKNIISIPPYLTVEERVAFIEENYIFITNLLKMKASKLKSYIKEQILSTLSSPVDEASAEEVENQKDLNKELEKTAQLKSQIAEDEDEMMIKKQ